MMVKDEKLLNIKTEWEEPVPQPEPPMRTVLLSRECCGVREPAKLEDIAKAIGISLSDATALLKHGSINAAWLAAQNEAKLWAYQAQHLQGQSGQGLSAQAVFGTK